MTSSPNARARLMRYAMMKLTRDFDARFESLLLTGRVTKWYSEVGNEATTIPAGLALGPGDALCTLHRDLGAILAVYLDPARTFPDFDFGEPDGTRPEPIPLLTRLACQLLGKDAGFSQGVERSFHYGYLDPSHGILHLGMISHLGSMIPVAAGCAYAFQRNGSDRVAMSFIGEGGTSVGDFHEGLNMAAVWKLPFILVIENNRYAFSTPASAQYAAQRLSDRGVGYGIAAENVDGNDSDAMSAAFERAVARARAGEGPTLIEAMLGRMRGHSEGDDSLKVVPQDELKTYLAADPVPAYRRRLEADGVLDAETAARLEHRIGELVEGAINQAIDAPGADPRTAMRPVFAADGTPPAVPARITVSEPLVAPQPEAERKETSYVDAVNLALREEMERDPTVLVLGQDIGAFEGAFRTTKGLHARWPDRVRDTPIAESGTIGVAIGAALLGYKPVIEMQFADFISNGFNQLVNIAAKLYYRWQVPCPIVIRLPSGGGVQAGPFHSQNDEGWFAQVAGLKVVCPATAIDARGLLKAAIRDPNPVLVFEHKFLYRRIKEVLPPEHEAVARLGEARVVRPGRDLTMVGYGSSTWWCLDAAAELAKAGIEAEVIDLRTLVPYDEETVLASVKRTHRALVVHEAPLTLGFGAEVVARLADKAFPWLDAPVRRVAYPDRPVPYARALENVLLPTRDQVIAAARDLVAF
jgi:2-oxoisovalerate dehydrogenase E1 component